MNTRALITAFVTTAVFAGASVSAETFITFQVPAGSPLLVKLQDPINASSATAGDQIEAKIWSPVIQAGTELIPADSTISGRIEAISLTSDAEPTTYVVLTFSLIEHAETRSRAAIRTRPAALTASQPKSDEKTKRSKAPRKPSGTVAAGVTFTAILAEPLVVRIPK